MGQDPRKPLIISASSLKGFPPGTRWREVREIVWEQTDKKVPKMVRVKTTVRELIRNER